MCQHRVGGILARFINTTIIQYSWHACLGVQSHCVHFTLIYPTNSFYYLNGSFVQQQSCYPPNNYNKILSKIFLYLVLLSMPSPEMYLCLRKGMWTMASVIRHLNISYTFSFQPGRGGAKFQHASISTDTHILHSSGWPDRNIGMCHH